jgi:hypothetical protein
VGDIRELEAESVEKSVQIARLTAVPPDAANARIRELEADISDLEDEIIDLKGGLDAPPGADFERLERFAEALLEQHGDINLGARQ